MHGYTVYEAADGAEAVRIADGHPIDLLVADVVMPILGGRAVLERLKAERPALRVLYVSGYVDDEVIRRGGLTADAALLHKPFTAGALLGAVRRALRARDEPASVAARGA
jgi:CheY-like chemotaxis protein